ncbi:MAG: septal ring lytic transglycosylase RlpA family protein [Geminicoccaceae bacterium]
MRYALVVGIALLLAACSSSAPPESPSQARTAAGSYKVGKPYQIDGKWYYPKFDPEYDEVGVASWYGDAFHGLSTANGEVFDKNRISAAHPTLPLPSLVRVTNLENGRSVVLRVNDRGPFVDDRLIDLSEAAARELGYQRTGLARVRVQFLQIAGAEDSIPAPVRVPSRKPVPRQAPVDSPVVLASAAPPKPPAPERAIPAARSGTEVAQAKRVAPASRVGNCTGSSWVVQVGAFADSASVRAVATQVGHLDHVQVSPAFAGKIPVARVQLGPVASRDAAATLLGKVQALGHDEAFVTCGPGGTVRVS